MKVAMTIGNGTILLPKRAAATPKWRLVWISHTCALTSFSLHFTFTWCRRCLCDHWTQWLKIYKNCLIFHKKRIVRNFLGGKSWIFAPKIVFFSLKNETFFNFFKHCVLYFIHAADIDFFPRSPFVKPLQCFNFSWRWTAILPSAESPLILDSDEILNMN